MNATALAEIAKIKQGARATWAAGDYGEVARRQLWPVGEAVVERLGLQPGEDLLDVACGTGNAALRAAAAGARVVAVDLTPELLAEGRRLADQQGLSIEWLQGDAEELPAADESFDVVVSTFGCMFAPRHALAASEIARVLRPGGRIAITTWPAGGAMGEFFRAVGPFMPAPSPLAEPPPLWGSAEHVEQLFAGTSVELEFDRGELAPPEFPSSRAALDFSSTKFGPLMMAREMTETTGRWEELEARLLALYERAEPTEYLLITGTKENR